MECITVLKTPEQSVTKLPPTFDFLAEPHISGESRFCSHKNQTFIHGTFLALFVVSFISHLYLHSQLLAKSDEIAILREKINDLLTAHEIDQINFKSRILQENGIPTGYLANEEHTRVRRNRRNHQCQIPHFFLKGHTEQSTNHHHISQTGVFFWKNEHVNTQAFSIIQNDSAGTPYLDGLQIQASGTYYLFAQVHVNGRTDARRTVDPSVGLSLRRTRNHRYSPNTTTLTTVFITQDNRGKPIPGRGQPARYPVDVLKLDGLFSLNREDIIYISRPPNEEFNDNIRYNNREGFAHFGGYMVEPTGPCIT